MSVEQNDFSFAKPLEFLLKVKFGGVVGKKTVIACVGLLVLAVAMGATWGKEYIILGLGGMVLAVIVLSMRSIDKTIEMRPDLALMDGAEMVRLEEVKMGAKGMSPVPNQPSISSIAAIEAHAVPVIEDRS